MKRNLRFALILLVLPAATALGEGGPLATYAPTLSPETAVLIAGADVEAGARTFERKCAQCHDGAKDGGHSKGPHLWNVIGRKAGSAPGFNYSNAMRGSGHTWNYATLDYFLSDTERAVPGRAMDLTGLQDAKMRAAVIAYLRTLGDNPPPLP